MEGELNGGDKASDAEDEVADAEVTTDSIESLLCKETSIAQLRNFLVRLEQGHFKRVAEARIAELKNLNIDQNTPHMTAAEKELAIKQARARKQLLPVPSCVARILSGDYTYISDDHKRLIQDCVPWTIQALKHSYLDQDIRRQVRLLLGTFQYTQCLSWAQPSWPKLMAGLRTEMLSIGREINEIYESDNLYEILGTLNPPLLEDTNFRQDCPGGEEQTVCSPVLVVYVDHGICGPMIQPQSCCCLQADECIISCS